MHSTAGRCTEEHGVISRPDRVASLAKHPSRKGIALNRDTLQQSTSTESIPIASKSMILNQRGEGRGTTRLAENGVVGDEAVCTEKEDCEPFGAMLGAKAMHAAEHAERRVGIGRDEWVCACSFAQRERP